MQELTTIKKACEITSEKVLAWARRVDIQREWKTLIEAKKTLKFLTLWKGVNKGII